MIVEESYYSGIETVYLFSSDEEKVFIQRFNNRTFTQFKDQTSAFSGVRF